MILALTPLESWAVLATAVGLGTRAAILTARRHLADDDRRRARFTAER